MTTTDIPTPKAPERPASKELRALGRKLKQGLRLERTGSDHYRIRDTRHDRLVEFRGRPIEFSQNPSPGSLRAIEDELREAQALRGTKPRAIADKGSERRAEALRATTAARAIRRQAEVEELRGQLEPFVRKIGGWETRGVVADVSLAARQLDGVEQRFTPDLLAGSLYRLSKGGWIESRYQEVWRNLAAHLAEVADPVEELFKLIRKGRGLPDEVVSTHPLAAVSPDGEWPYVVELLPLDRLLVDHAYQRPVDWPWVRKTAAAFDPTLVGSIDVSSRRHGAAFAIMDGQGRFETIKMVGKSSVYANVYLGLDLESEARFFLHKNRDRKAVHPYHIWKAKLTAKTPETLAIAAIVAQTGYAVAGHSAGSTNAKGNEISAVQSLEEVYRRSSDVYKECLTPTLELLSRTTSGRRRGQDSMLIKGTGRIFQLFGEKLDVDRFADVLTERGPEWLLGRSREESANSGSQHRAIVLVLAAAYNRGLTGSARLVVPASARSLL